MRGDDPDVAKRAEPKDRKAVVGQTRRENRNSRGRRALLRMGACEPSFQAHRLIRQEAISAFDETWHI